MSEVTKQKNIVTDNLKILDTMRGFASIYVLAGHARWLLLEPMKGGYLLHPGSYNFINKIGLFFFSLFAFGHQSVLFFFVLSGFVIHWSVSKRVDKTQSFDTRDYLYRRFKRIYPPLILAIVITFIIDSIGRSQGYSIYFSVTHYPIINQSIHPDLSLKALLGNLGFVQTIYTPVWGSDGALWSLTYEWWFYILYIPIGWLFRKNKILTSVMIYIIWLLSFGGFIPNVLLTAILNYFVAWYLGVLLADMLLYKTFDFKVYGLYLAMIAGYCLINLNKVSEDILLSVGIVILLYVMLTTNIFSFLKKIHKLGEFSYTLYVVHLPIIVFISGYVLSKNNQILPIHSAYVIAGIAISIILAWLLHFVVEKPFVGKQKKAGAT